MSTPREETGSKTSRRQALAVAAGALACLGISPAAGCDASGAGASTKLTEPAPSGSEKGMPPSKVVIIVYGGVVQDVFADGAQVYLMDFDESERYGGPHEWNVGRFPTAPLHELAGAFVEERKQNEEVAVVIRAVTGG